jgi:hypothetical protein
VRRSSSVAILAVCFVLLGGTVLATAGSIALGAWQPVWDRPDPTRGPVEPGQGPIGPPPGGGDGEATYEEMLDEVRAGTVRTIRHDTVGGVFLYAESEFYGVMVIPPDDDADVYADIEAAATEAGVAVPLYFLNGVPANVEERPYAEFLEQVRAGQVHFVTQTGDILSYETDQGPLGVMGAPEAGQVIRDIREVADEAGVMPPAFAWNPG